MRFCAFAGLTAIEVSLCGPIPCPFAPSQSVLTLAPVCVAVVQIAVPALADGDVPKTALVTGAGAFKTLCAKSTGCWLSSASAVAMPMPRPIAAVAKMIAPARRRCRTFDPFIRLPSLFSPLLRWEYRKVSPSARQTAQVIFEPELETLPTERLHALQVERLRALIARVKERVPIYGDRLADVEPGDIASLDDLRRLPFTRKDDLRDTYPFGMFAVPPEEIVRIHASSGTTGKLTVVGYTAADVDLLARVNARSLAMAGAGPGMMLHNAYGYGLFTGGLGLHYGGERLGMAVVPVSVGMTERQLMLITDFRPDMIACTPSYALTLVQSFQERAVAPA